MVELFSHLGLVPVKDPSGTSILYKLRGLITWGILLFVLIVYQCISVTCSISSYAFPETSVTTKQSACLIFWDLCLYLMKLNHVNYHITGDAITSESAVFISNHRSLVDHMAINYLARYSYGINNAIGRPIVNFFTWFLMWKVPSIKILLNLGKIDENWELDTSLNEVFFNILFNSKKQEWLVLFPEVNIFTKESSTLQQLQCQKFFLPVFNNVLYPRFSSFFNVISMISIKETYKFNTLYDLTIYYYKINASQEKIYFSPNLLEIFSNNEPITINIDVKLRNLAKVSNNRNKLERWLEKNWIDKDNFLENIMLHEHALPFD